MTRILRILSLTAAVALTAAQADARPIRSFPRPQPNSTVKAREAAMKAFATRMDRLDALMGRPSGRSRSASAEH